MDYDDFTEIINDLKDNHNINSLQLFLIDNTIDYCETYAEEYDRDEIIEHIINNNYVEPDMSDIETCSWEICQDLGYKISF